MNKENKMEYLVDAVEQFLSNIPLNIDVEVEYGDDTFASAKDNTICVGYDLLGQSQDSKMVDMFYRAIHETMQLKLDISTVTYSILHELGHLIASTVYSIPEEKVSHIYQVERENAQFITQKYGILRGMYKYYYQLCELDANIYANVLRLAYPEQIKSLDKQIIDILAESDDDCEYEE